MSMCAWEVQQPSAQASHCHARLKPSPKRLPEKNEGNSTGNGATGRGPAGDSIPAVDGGARGGDWLALPCPVVASGCRGRHSTGGLECRPDLDE